MASYTPNYNLKKPADSDYYDIADDNGNMDKIDTALNTLNSNITRLNSENNMTNDILADALNVTRTTFFRASSLAAYTGNVPSDNFKVGSFIVNVRGTARHVTAVAANGNIATNIYSGSSWVGWKEITSNDLLGIVTVDGKAPSAIPNGQYIMHQGVLRRAKTNIASGDTITSSNSSAVTGGGLNDLKSDVDKLITNTSSRYIKHFIFQNVSSIVVDLGREQTNSAFSNVEVVNTNQGILSGATGASEHVTNYGSTTMVFSTSGSNLTIKRDDNGTMWGITHVTLAANYDLFG